MENTGKGKTIDDVKERGSRLNEEEKLQVERER